MGSMLSSRRNSGSSNPKPFIGGMQSEAGGSEDDDSRVIGYHSSDQWKLQLDSNKGSTQLMVVDFTASWCGPCKMMKPVLKDFASKYQDVLFIKIDVDKLKDVARDFDIQAMPTFVFVKRGNEVDRLIGANKDELQQKIEKHMA